MKAIFAAAFFLFTSSAIAQSVQIRLPEKGYYHVGEYMDVEVWADRDATVVLHADGALDTIVSMHGKTSVRAPMLMLLGEARTLTAGSKSVPIQALPNDAIDYAPQPHGSVLRIDAYAPVLAWHPPASPRTVRMVILIASLVSILLCAAAILLRTNRAKLIASIVVVILATLGIEIWRRNIPTIWTATGQIVVSRPSGTQIDTWKYYTSRTPAPLRIDILDRTWPVFIDADHARKLNARLEYDGATSTMSVLCDLTAELKFATCTRKTSEVWIDRAPSNDTKSPMQALAERMYLGPNTSVLGEGDVSGVSDQDVRYRAVILRSRFIAR